MCVHYTRVHRRACPAVALQCHSQRRQRILYPLSWLPGLPMPPNSSLLGSSPSHELLPKTATIPTVQCKGFPEISVTFFFLHVVCGVLFWTILCGWRIPSVNFPDLKQKIRKAACLALVATENFKYPHPIRFWCAIISATLQGFGKKLAQHCAFSPVVPDSLLSYTHTLYPTLVSFPPTPSLHTFSCFGQIIKVPGWPILYPCPSFPDFPSWGFVPLWKSKSLDCAIWVRCEALHRTLFSQVSQRTEGSHPGYPHISGGLGLVTFQASLTPLYTDCVWFVLSSGLAGWFCSPDSSTPWHSQS